MIERLYKIKKKKLYSYNRLQKRFILSRNCCLLTIMNLDDDDDEEKSNKKKKSTQLKKRERENLFRHKEMSLKNALLLFFFIYRSN